MSTSWWYFYETVATNGWYADDVFVFDETNGTEVVGDRISPTCNDREFKHLWLLAGFSGNYGTASGCLHIYDAINFV